MTIHLKRPGFLAVGTSALAGVCLLAGLAHASDHEGGSRQAPLPKYQQECSACHVAFPAKRLPAASWQRLMSNLPKHFGTDASLDPASVQEISTWLTANAASGRRAAEAPPQDRITTSAWFVREHSEISPAVWKSPKVGKASNCAACHIHAPDGVFSEHDVRIPR